MSNVTSNATNFIDSTSTNVDPRTGIFNAHINITKLLSSKTSGAPYDFSISYNSSSNVDLGFGRGWGYSLSSFDLKSKRLTLSSGQVFEIKWDDTLGEFIAPYRKLKDIKILYLEKIDNEPSSIVLHFKDGTSEYISYEEGILYKRVSSNGLVVNFEYANSYQPNSFGLTLWKISDDSGQSIEIDWWTNEYKTTVTHNSLGSVLKTCSILKIGRGDWKGLGYIYFEEEPYTEFQYRWIESCNYEVIEKVIHGTGLQEEITYLDNGHSLPDGAPISKVPFVTKHILYPGENQNIKKTLYYYTDMNYLGFGSEQSWQSGEDTLFKAKSDYKYTTKEVINDTIQIERTFNKYHLMDLELHTCNEKLFKEVAYSYFADLSKGIESQPGIYTLIKSEILKFYNDDNGYKSFKTEYDYDDFGNLLKQINSDGSIIERKYYPKEGDSDCPENPHGFVAQLKEESFIPGSSQFNIRRRNFTYTSLPRLDDNSRYFVLLDSSSSNYSKITTRNHYFDNNENIYTYGRVKTVIKTIEGKETSYNFDYEFYDNSLEINLNVSSFDGLNSTSSNTIDLLYGNLIKSIDSVGAEIVYQYDPLGIKISEVFAPNTDYEATRTYSYIRGENQNSVTITESIGNVMVINFNNAGKHVNSYLNGKRVNSIRYDAFGQAIEEDDIDYLSDKIIILTTKYNYDSNRQINRVEHPDGRIENIEQDIPTLTSFTEIVGLVKEKVSYNMSGNPVFRETQDINGKSVLKSSYNYDGYQNIISIIDTNNRETQFEYDDLDRLVTTKKTIDGVLVAESLTYPTFVEMDTPATIALDKSILGSRAFDGFGRVTTEDSAKGLRHWTYTNGNPFPNTEITPTGQVLYPKYDLYLGAQTSLEVESDEKLARLYQYDKAIGTLKSSQNIHGEHTFTYDSFGRVTKEVVTLNDNIPREAKYSYSLLGKLEEKWDFFNNKTVYKYDDLGRVKTISQEILGKNYCTEITYDQFSRPYFYTVKNGKETSATVEVVFDFLGMELSRSFVTRDYSKTISNTFNSDQLISNRVFTDSEGINITEYYMYDDMLRLVNYRCSGNSAPKDEYGNAISEQIFKYDTYGNITQTTSTFVDKTYNQMDLIYDEKTPSRLVNIVNTHQSYPASIEFNYDASGNLLNDEQGLNYEYNALDQISSITNNSSTLSNYGHDEFGQLVSQTIEDIHTYLLYQQGELRHEISEGTYTILENAGLTLRRCTVDNQIKQEDLLLLDTQGSVTTEVTKHEDGSLTTKSHLYTAYGEEGR
ncbi:hypothetical protein ACXZ7R_21460 [Vibrio campbellii]